MTITINTVKNIRTFKQKGQPWFCAADLAAFLGLKSTSAGLNLTRVGGVVASEEQFVPTGTQGRPPRFISASGLRKIVKAVDNEAFGSFVTDTLIPSAKAA